MSLALSEPPSSPGRHARRGALVRDIGVNAVLPGALHLSPRHALRHSPRHWGTDIVLALAIRARGVPARTDLTVQPDHAIGAGRDVRVHGGRPSGRIITRYEPLLLRAG